MKCKCCGKILPSKFFYRGGKRYKTCGHCRTRQRQLYQENDDYREYKKDYRKEYYQNNKPKIRAYQRKWAKKNRTYRSQTRRRLEKELPNDFTPRQWALTIVFFDSRCVYCNTKSLSLEQDHFIPLSKGGGKTLGNIVPCCRECNADKNADYPWIFMKRRDLDYRKLHRRITSLIVFVQEHDE